MDFCLIPHPSLNYYLWSKILRNKAHIFELRINFQPIQIVLFGLNSPQLSPSAWLDIR